MMKYFSQIDEKMRELTLVMRHPVLDEILLTVTYLGKWYFLLSIITIIAVWLFKEHRLRDMYLLLFASLGTFFTVAVLKLGFDRARPEDPLALAMSTTPSFPSMHAALSFAVFTALAVIFARRAKTTSTKWAVCFSAAALIFTVGMSRVYLGVHFFSDVLAGWIVASLILLGGYLLFKKD